MITIKREVREALLASLEESDRVVEAMGAPTSSMRAYAEEMLYRYEGGIWFEMHDRGLSFWWQCMAIAALCLTAFFMLFTTAPILYILTLTSGWMIASSGVIFLVLYLQARVSRHLVEKALVAAEKMLLKQKTDASD